jgi:hypothetical protein
MVYIGDYGIWSEKCCSNPECEVCGLEVYSPLPKCIKCGGVWGEVDYVEREGHDKQNV